MNDRKKKISVIIANWNRKEDTLATLYSLRECLLNNFSLEIIVVDNGSHDGSSEAVEKFSGTASKNGFSIRQIINKENLGFCRGNNVGIKDALKEDADYIVLLNNDTIVDKNIFVDFLNALERNHNVGAISPKIYFTPGYEFHKERYKKSDLGKVIWAAGGDIDWKNVYASNHGVDAVDRGQFDQLRQIDFGTGACLFVPAEVIKRVGMLDEKLFAYFEDADLCLRIKRMGLRIVYSPKPYLWHKVSQTSGIGSDLNDYFITRNRMLFGLKYAPLRAKLALIKESIKLLLKGREWQKIGIRDFYLMKFGRGSWP
ncbi:glycosyltransferase family 2 protein [Patescibacteria group bacterium]|nr:glycosyltransferase family 2 protein [Patescibacteria group bacterium]